MPRLELSAGTVCRNKLSEELDDHDVTGRRPRFDPDGADDTNDVVLGTLHLDDVPDPAGRVTANAGVETRRHLRPARRRHVSQNFLHAHTAVWWRCKLTSNMITNR